MNLWRTLLYPGQQTYAWHLREPDGQKWDYRLDGSRLLAQSDWVRHPQWYTRSYQTVLTVPVDIPPGNYDLNGETVRIECQPAPRPLVKIQPGEDLRSQLSAGFDVLLAPGRHELRGRLDTWHPSGPGRLLGSGRDCTTLIRIPDGDYAERMIAPSSGFTVSDLTLVPVAYAFHGIIAENVTVERIRFVGGEFGEFHSSGLLVRDCLFEETVIAKQTAGLWHRCRFYRSGINSRSTEGLCILDCDFEQGGLNFGGDPVQNCLFHGLQFHGTQGRDNGSEIVLVEGNAHLKNCLFTGLRVRGGEGVPFQVYEASATGNIVWDYAFDQAGTTGRAVWFYSTVGHAQRNNLFARGEIRGGRVDFGPSASGNRIIQTGFVSPRPSRGNQLSDYREHWYGYQEMFQAAPATGNLVQDCCLVDLPEFWTIGENVELHRVRVY